MGFPEDLSDAFRARYTIAELLGEGAYGAVFRAVQRDLNRDVAIKFLKYDEDCPLSVFERFHREAKILAAIEHPLVLKIYDYGQDGSTPFIVTPFVKGRNLRAHMRGKVFGVPEAIRIGTQVLEALEHIHALGILHRDLKPENLLVEHDGSIRVADFGVAHIHSEGSRLTRDGTVMGTPRYLAPELLVSAKYSVASDIYAVGTIVFELVAGRPPFTAGSVSEGVKLKLTSRPSTLRIIDASLPEDLDAAVDRALERDPDRRYGSARAMRDAIATCLKDYCRVSAGPENVFSDTSIDTLVSIASGPNSTQVRTNPSAPVRRPTAGSRAVGANATADTSPVGQPAVTQRAAGIALGALVCLTLTSFALLRARRPPPAGTTAASPPGTAARARPIGGPVTGEMLAALEQVHVPERVREVGMEWRREASRPRDPGERAASMAAWVEGLRRRVRDVLAGPGLPALAARFRAACATDPLLTRPAGPEGHALYMALQDLEDLRVLLDAMEAETAALAATGGPAASEVRHRSDTDTPFDWMAGLLPPAWRESTRASLAHPEAYTLAGLEKDGTRDQAAPVAAPGEAVVDAWRPVRFFSAWYGLFGDGFEKRFLATDSGNPAQMVSAIRDKPHMDYAHDREIPLPARDTLEGLELATAVGDPDPRCYFVIRMGNDDAGWRDVATIGRHDRPDGTPTYIALDPALVPPGPVHLSVRLRYVPETSSDFHRTFHFLSIRWTRNPTGVER